MNEKIMNITSDGKVICDDFTMSLEEFYDIVFKNTVSDYENYHIRFSPIWEKNCYYATFKGKEYRVKHDNKEYKDVWKDLGASSYYGDESDGWYDGLFRVKFPYDDTYILDRLVIMNGKMISINRLKGFIAKHEKEKKYFNKDNFLGVNDLNIEKYKVSKADAIFSVILIFSNLFSFFSIPIRDFYASLGSYSLLTFVPFYAKFVYDLNSMKDNSKRKTFLYYALYPILYIHSKKKCEKSIERLNNEIKLFEEEINEYIKQDANERILVIERCIANCNYDNFLVDRYIEDEQLSEAAKAARELLRQEKLEEKTEEESRGIQKTLKR